MLGSGIAQPREPDGSLITSHPSFRPHLVQGWTPDFIPKLTEDALAAKLVDRVVPIDSGEAMRLSRALAQEEGIFTGISGGATFAGALEVCRSAPEGATILCMLPDTGERYLSTPLFEGIAADMTAEEIAIANSAPQATCAVRPPSASSPSAATKATPEVEAFVAGLLADKENPVVLFAFEWCEFCWSVRKLFKKCGIPYRSIDIDSVDYQKDDRGGKVRAAVAARTGSVTIPQIFVGGQFIGGASEVFDAFKAGHLQQLLADSGVTFEAGLTFDPYTLLPNWLSAGTPS
jgi:cysteine synthase A